ncbi:helix-turn-helix transcriptional regulator [Paramicrobacterium agarici]|uniref:Putative transcriptional regulator YheO n=1 Tax=Paramicrobacterium agarici TaxID=630514 RepID=A0A2A9DUM0_9MICO|nr:PAS domain-containing protein [Microbacterium agarici]PFG29855.1 putative transcriptional regulator YheO [Microbacterium agarici]
MPSDTVVALHDESAESRIYETVDEICAVYRPVMHAMAAAAGPGCEVVLHDLSADNPDLDHTIIAIENGHVTGRSVGGPSTSLGAGVIHNQGADHDAFGYRGFTSDGRQLRCSSIYFRNRAGKIMAALCINVDVSALQQARTLLDSLVPQTASDSPDAPSEFFGQDLVSVMDAMVTDAIQSIGKPVAQMSRDDRISVVRTLDQQGALQMRKGMEHIASRLGISRVTAYSYLDEARADPNIPEAGAV